MGKIAVGLLLLWAEIGHAANPPDYCENLLAPGALKPILSELIADNSDQTVLYHLRGRFSPLSSEEFQELNTYTHSLKYMDVEMSLVKVSAQNNALMMDYKMVGLGRDLAHVLTDLQSKPIVRKAQAWSAVRGRIEPPSTAFISPLSVERLNQLLSEPLTSIQLSEYTRKIFDEAKILTLGDLVRKTPRELMRLPHFDRSSLLEVEQILTTLDLALGMSFPTGVQ